MPPRVTGVTGSADPTRQPTSALPLADTENEPEYDFATSEAYKTTHADAPSALPNIDLNETAERSLEITSQLQASRAVTLDKGPTGYDMHVTVDGRCACCWSGSNVRVPVRIRPEWYLGNGQHSLSVLYEYLQAMRWMYP